MTTRLPRRPMARVGPGTDRGDPARTTFDGRARRAGRAGTAAAVVVAVLRVEEHHGGRLVVDPAS